jgi:gluconate 5-dehydrogenase
MVPEQPQPQASARGNTLSSYTKIVNDIFSLAGKTALVAGASRGIGLAIAQGLADAGAHTVLAARSTDKLEEQAGDLTAKGHKASAVRMDMADSKSIDAALSTLDAIDILINVAGTNIRKPFQDYTKQEYEFILQTNLHGLVELTQKVGAKMIARGAGGKVITIGSLMSLLGLPYLSIYAITKGALGQLTKVLAAEWGKHNIQVNCIAPGFILTDLNRTMWQQPHMSEWLKGNQANPRLGRPDDIAPLAVFLSGRGADYITGQIIAVDGGYTTTSVWPFEP